MKAGGLAEHVLSEVNGSADDAQDDKLVDVVQSSLRYFCLFCLFIRNILVD